MSCALLYVVSPNNTEISKFISYGLPHYSIKALSSNFDGRIKGKKKKTRWSGGSDNAGNFPVAVANSASEVAVSSEQRVYDVVLKQAALVKEQLGCTGQIDVKPDIVIPGTLSLLSEAYDRCGEVCAEYAKTFYLGTLLMTPEKRKAIWAIYVWCRRTDELVDGPNASHITPKALDRWESRLEDLYEGRPYDMLDAALSDTVLKFPVDIQDSEEVKLERILKEAAIGGKTVILTTLNEAWAAPGSIIDLFLESFRIGDHTRKLLNHLVIIALDQKAYSRCLAVHGYCFPLSTEGVDFSKEAYFMTPDYLKMMWRRIAFLLSVLEMGYDFIFTDADIMWFRDPFPRFYPDADFQIACDLFFGSSYDLQNRPNGGFNYVKSNNRTIEFYKFWYSSREIHPGYHDQDVLNMIKFDPFIMEVGLKMRFLNTAYFGGFCEPSKDLNQVCTMHANCCYGLDNKVHDLKIMLEDWRFFLSLPPTVKRSTLSSWRVPQNCSLASLHTNNLPVESVVEGEIGDTQN